MESVVVTTAGAHDLAKLAAVAAATFPLACPPSATAENIAAFVADNLSAARFGEYLTDPDRTVFVARDDTRILGYAMVIHRRTTDPDVLAALPDGQVAELSKIYVTPDAHGGQQLPPRRARNRRESAQRDQCPIVGDVVVDLSDEIGQIPRCLRPSGLEPSEFGGLRRRDADPRIPGVDLPDDGRGHLHVYVDSGGRSRYPPREPVGVRRPGPARRARVRPVGGLTPVPHRPRRQPPA